MKAIMMGKMEKLDIKSRSAIVRSADDYVFHIIVENLSGDAMKITKCPDMTIHEDIQCAALHKLDVHIAGITEDQGKGINGGCPPVWFLNLKITPVNLGL